MKTKSLIAALLLAASSAFAQVPSYVPTNGLVGWWPFNGNANDESGNGHNGNVVFNGSTGSIGLTTDRNGSSNKAYHFAGSYITCNNPSFCNFGNSDFTISTWFRTNQNDGIANDHPFVYYGSFATINCSWVLRTWANGTISGSIFNSSISPSGGVTISNNSYTDNIWHQALFVRNTSSSIVSLYIDGQLVNSQNLVGIANIIGSNQAQLYFGWNPNTGSIFADIDDIGIWNRALTQQEITALYNAQSCTGTGAITADGPTTFCAGNFVNLTSDVVGGTYQWKKNGVNVTSNGTSRTYKATATGTYTCVAMCNGTALTSNAIAVSSKTNAAATVSASGATSFCAGDSVTLNATNLGSNYSVQWYRTNVSMENATNYSQVVKQPGTYKVVTRNLTNGCSRISGSSVVVAVNCRLANPDVIAADITESDFAARGVNDEPKGKIYIYPNPTSDNKFTVELMGLELNGDATLEVYNAMGQILSSEKVNITNGTLNRTIQIDEQGKGQLCIVRLIIGSEVYDSKVILK